MNNLITYLDRHPVQAALLVVALFGIAGTMDNNDQERADAYQAGLTSGMQLATEIDTRDLDVGQQLADLCDQEWGRIPNAEEARKRACGPA